MTDVARTIPPASGFGGAYERFSDDGVAHFAPPGHKRSAALDPLGLLGNDLTLFGGLDDLQLSGRLLDLAQRAAARTWGALHTRFTTQGTTHLNLALALACTIEDEPVAVARTSHRSVLAGLVLSGARPSWIVPVAAGPLRLPGPVTAADVARTRALGPTPTAVWVPDPTYHGLLAPIGEIAAQAHRDGLPLLCDQAWGAHFGLHPHLALPAGSLGADVATLSVHKTLSAFSQGALVTVHDESRVDLTRLDAALDLLRTTSASGLILASLDQARQLIDRDGTHLLGSALARVSTLRRQLEAIPGIRCADEQLRQAGQPVDPLRLIVDLDATGVSGYDLERHLRARGVHLQLADETHFVPLVTFADTSADLDRLVAAIADAVATLPRRPRSEPARETLWRELPEQGATPRTALGARHERMDADRAAGRIAAEIVAPYPPGVPVLVPGERITATLVHELQRLATLGVRMSGPTDTSLRTLLVLA